MVRDLYVWGRWEWKCIPLLLQIYICVQEVKKKKKEGPTSATGCGSGRLARPLNPLSVSRDLRKPAAEPTWLSPHRVEHGPHYPLLLVHPRTEFATELINRTTALGVPVATLIVRCGRDWLPVNDATTAVRWMIPGAAGQTDFAARTANAAQAAQAAQAAERTHYEKIRQCIAVHRMSAVQHRLDAAPKDTSFGGPLPPKWLDVPPLYLMDAQLGDRPLPIGVTERVSGPQMSA